MVFDDSYFVYIVGDDKNKIVLRDLVSCIISLKVGQRFKDHIVDVFDLVSDCVLCFIDSEHSHEGITRIEVVDNEFCHVIVLMKYYRIVRYFVWEWDEEVERVLSVASGCRDRAVCGPLGYCV